MTGFSPGIFNSVMVIATLLNGRGRGGCGARTGSRGGALVGGQPSLFSEIKGLILALYMSEKTSLIALLLVGLRGINTRGGSSSLVWLRMHDNQFW